MSLVSDVLEHNNVKILGLLALVIGYVLDANNQSEYFYMALVLAVVVILVTLVQILYVKKVYDHETIWIPLVIKIESNESGQTVLQGLFKEIEKNSDFTNLEKNLKRYSNIVAQDLVFEYSGELFDKERLISFMQIIKYQITQIRQNFPNRVQFHLAFYNKPAVGFLVGTLFDKEDVVIYQQNPDEDLFDRVAHLTKRNYKTEVLEYKNFSIREKFDDKESSTVLLSIKASSHQIALNADSLEKYKNRVIMHAKHNGTIDLKEDWILYEREIFTQLNKLQTEYKKIVIAHAMPESIAVMVGMAVGTYWNISMTQYKDGEYLELICLDEVKCYF